MFTVYKRLTFTAVMILFMFTLLHPVSVAAQPKEFPDIKGHWAEADILFLADQGVIGGYPDGNFYPTQNISRRELAKIALALYPAGAKLAASNSSTPDYLDIHSGWGQEYLSAAANYLPGYTDGHFKPDTPATRYEVAWLALAASLAEHGHFKQENNKLFIELPMPDENAWRQAIKFKEYTGLPERYRKSTAYLPEDPDKKDFFSNAGYFFTDLNPVALLAGEGFLKGYTDGTVGLDREVTRAETAAIISRVCKAEFSDTDQYLLEPAGKVYRPRTVQLTSANAADRLNQAGAFYQNKYSDPLQRAGMIYNLMIHVFNYDWDTREGLKQYAVADIVGLMRTGQGTDEGLVSYYTTLAAAAGLSAQTIKGQAVNPGDSGLHTWVELNIGGLTVPVDPTYGVCTGNIYFNNFSTWNNQGYQWIKETS
ncbi:MAG: S-layer homology domain-containing protein [Desulfotomaculaceae bacterium]